MAGHEAVPSLRVVTTSNQLGRRLHPGMVDGARVRRVYHLGDREALHALRLGRQRHHLGRWSRSALLGRPRDLHLVERAKIAVLRAA